MRFGKTLQSSIYPPWRAHYIDYSKLKQLLRENDESDDGQELRHHKQKEEEAWTEHDESRFVDELINVQLEKVHKFHLGTNKELNERTEMCEKRLEKLVVPPGQSPLHLHYQGPAVVDDAEKERILRRTLKDLDDIAKDINELERFSRINFTGFLKAAKKHDRRSRGRASAKGKKGATHVADPKVKPLLQVRLSHLEFNKEDYSPLLYRLSTMFDFVRRSLHEEQLPAEPNAASATAPTNAAGSDKKYTSHKFWVHPDNIIEVKTFILRRLPVLVYNAQPSKELDVVGQDPTITSLYFDNPGFELYSDKVLKAKDASSLRLRWYGQLSQAAEIFLERKTISGPDDGEGATEERIGLKPKYVNEFIAGNHSMEKTAQKIGERKSAEEADKYRALVASLQDLILSRDLAPTLRASYTRTAFQIPGDDRIRVSLDTDMALIREDSLDEVRPCREPEDWHRRDIDDARMEHPFEALRKGEISRFPYALLAIKVRDSELHPRTREWVEELMASHLVHGAPRFSKFVHGVAVLFDDYVNSFPFWLGDLEDDIRKDPRKAWHAEQERKKKQMEDETAVGSFRPSVGAGGFGGRGTPPAPPGFGHRGTPPPPPLAAAGPSGAMVGSASVERGSGGFAKLAAASKMLPPEEADEDARRDDDDESDGSDDDDDGKAAPQGYGGSTTLDGLRQLFPSFSSSSRYGRAHSGQRAVVLPAGVQKPKQLIMYSGEVKVEAKVWLANQRTFIKWMHIVVLLASLGVALYNAAPRGHSSAKSISLAYTAIAVFAGIWGWVVYMWRSSLIRQRSGRDFDSVFGPVVVCVALAVALVVNFTFKYRGAKGAAGWNAGNETIADELARLAETEL